MEIIAAPSDILAYAARMNLGEYYQKKMKKEDASLNSGECHQEKDNFDLALDAFYDAYRFARQIDFETRPALCSWGDLLMDSDLFDEAVQLYTDAEDAKDSRLSDASKLPQELRKSKLCAMIKLARALRKSGRLALSINKLVNVISDISIKLARTSRKRGRKQALLIRELTSDISEASSKECVFRLVSMLREIGGSCIAKGFLIKISDKRGYFWSVNVRHLIEKLNLDMRSKVSNAPHPQLILLRKMIEDEERLKAEEERLKDEEEKVKAQKEEKLAADKREHEQALRDEFNSQKEDFFWGNSNGHTQLKPPCHEPVTTYFKSHFSQRSIEAIAHLHGFKCPQCHQGDRHERSVYLLQLKVTTASVFCPCNWCPQANPYLTIKHWIWCITRTLCR